MQTTGLLFLIERLGTDPFQIHIDGRAEYLQLTPPYHFTVSSASREIRYSFQDSSGD